LPAIEVWNAPNTRLEELLDLVDTKVLRWSILEIWAIAKDDATDVLNLEQRCAASPTGLLVSGAELRLIALQLAQVIDGIFVGYEGDPPTRVTADLREDCEVVIEAIDSTLWRIYAREAMLMERFVRAGLTNVLKVVSERAIPPSHGPS